MKGGAHPSPFAALSFPNTKRYPFSAGLTERVFQSPHGAAEPRTHAIRDFLHHSRAALTTRPRRLENVSKCMFKSLSKSCYRSLNIGTGMSEQILKTEVRLFRDSSISHFTSMFVANQMIVRSVKVKSV